MKSNVDARGFHQSLPLLACTSPIKKVDHTKSYEPICDGCQGVGSLDRDLGEHDYMLDSIVDNSASVLT